MAGKKSNSKGTHTLGLSHVFTNRTYLNKVVISIPVFQEIAVNILQNTLKRIIFECSHRCQLYVPFKKKTKKKRCTSIAFDIHEKQLHVQF